MCFCGIVMSSFSDPRHVSRVWCITCVRSHKVSQVYWQNVICQSRAKDWSYETGCRKVIRWSRGNDSSYKTCCWIAICADRGEGLTYEIRCRQHIRWIETMTWDLTLILWIVVFLWPDCVVLLCSQVCLTATRLRSRCAQIVIVLSLNCDFTAVRLQCGFCQIVVLLWSDRGLGRDLIMKR